MTLGRFFRLVLRPAGKNRPQRPPNYQPTEPSPTSADIRSPNTKTATLSRGGSPLWFRNQE